MHADMVDVGFEVLTEVVMKSSVFWVVTPCSPLKVRDIAEVTCSSKTMVNF
jgi:hypothetical protein